MRTCSPRPNTFDFDNVERNLWMKNSSKHFLKETLFNLHRQFFVWINSPTHRISNSHNNTGIFVTTHTFSTDSRSKTTIRLVLSFPLSNSHLFVAACSAWKASSSSSVLWHISAKQRDVPRIDQTDRVIFLRLFSWGFFFSNALKESKKKTNKQPNWSQTREKKTPHSWWSID